MKRYIICLIIGLLLLNAGGTISLAQETIDQLHITEKVSFSEPVLIDSGEFLNLAIANTQVCTNEPGAPKLPFYRATYVFPFGTKISDVTVTIDGQKELQIYADIMPVPQPQLVAGSIRKPQTNRVIKNSALYDQHILYPLERFSYTTSAGLQNNEHVIFLTIDYFPVQYNPGEHLLSFTADVTFTILYTPPLQPLVWADAYDLLIITPAEFTSSIQPLVDHKISYGLETMVMTTEEMYTQYPGRDSAEKIKYGIKDVLETFGVSFVLLIGGYDKLPIRESHISLWHFEDTVLTDLYYSDIYTGSGEFSSWDTNGNNLFGEWSDIVDLRPDVHIGRLACNSTEEVDVVTDKIMYYEQNTYGQVWYKDMIFIGGDTFPRWNGNEGEDTNEIIMAIMSDFTPSAIIWTSEGNFNRKTISNAITAGAGFMDYSGHGFEHGMGTYAPNGNRLLCYLTPYIKDLENGYELPIIFFDACLTAKLDFVLQDVLNYRNYWMFNLLAKIFRIDTSVRLPCYAWSFVQHEGGGAIATIGATRTAYGGTDAGAGKISIEFFQAYKDCEFLGEMMTIAQNEYIKDVSDDPFTVEEFILLGDPTLKLGGYSTS